MSASGRSATVGCDGRDQPARLHLSLLRDLQSVVDLYPEVPDRALKFAMAQGEVGPGRWALVAQSENGGRRIAVVRGAGKRPFRSRPRSLTPKKASCDRLRLNKYVTRRNVYLTEEKDHVTAHQ